MRKTVYLQYSKLLKGHTFDTSRRHSNLICSTVKQSLMQTFSSIYQNMEEKSAEHDRKDGESDKRTDGDPDGHHHTIIRPACRLVYIYIG